MSGYQIDQLFRPQRALNAPAAENVPLMTMRATAYAEQVVANMTPTKHPLAAEGSYFMVANPTPGTALATDIKTSFSDTVPLIYMANTDSPTNPSAKSIFFDYLKLIVTVAGASATTCRFAFRVDRVARALGTNNTTAFTPFSPNSGNANSSIATVNVQSSATASAVAAASASVRNVGNASLGGIMIVGDELVIQSGNIDRSTSSGLTAAQAVTPGTKLAVIPPIIIAPGHSLVIHSWYANNASTAPSYEFEMCWWERAA